jgi:hypothetical protein
MRKKKRGEAMRSYAFLGGAVLGLVIGTAIGFFLIPMLLA